MAAPVDERLERYAELAVRVGANVEAGQTVFIGAIDRARAARPRPDARGVRRRRALRRRPLRRPARPPGDDRVRPRRGARAHARVAEDPLTRTSAGNALIATTGDPEPDLLADLDGERVGRARMRELNEIIRGLMVDRPHQLDRSRLPERRLGREGLRRARRRAALGGGRVLHAPRRARPGRRLARAHGEARGAGRAAERAQVRRAALPRPGHRLHGRAPAERPLDVGALPHRRRPRVRPEHADRGDLHDTRLPARRGDDHLDPAAGARPGT